MRQDSRFIHNQKLNFHPFPNSNSRSLISDYKFIQIFHKNLQASKKVITQCGIATIIMEATGQGKSILMNYLADVKLKSVKDQLTFQIVLQAEDENKIISRYSHQTNSCTEAPVKVIANGRVFYDCPGFSPTQGPLQDILNALYIEQVFKKSRNVEIMLVISQNKMLPRATSLFSILNLLYEIYENKQDIMDSLSMVITKAKFPTQQHARTFMNVVKEQNKQSFKYHKNIQDIICYFGRQNSRLSIFKLPQHSGQIIENQDALKIFQMLTRSKPISNPKIKLPLAPETIIKLRQIFDQCSNAAKQFAFQLNTEVISFIHKELINCQSFNHAHPMLIQLKQVFDRFGSYKDHEGVKSIKKNYQMIAFAIRRILPEFILHCSSFLHAISENQIIQSRINIENWIVSLTAKQFIKDILQDIEIDFSAGILNIRGFIIGSELIQRKFNQYNLIQRVTTVKVNCYNFLYLDQDLVMGSINLIIYANNWIICGPDLKNDTQKFRIINLSGKNAQTIQEQRAPQVIGMNQNGSGRNGNNGLPGLPGEHGGNFYGYKTQDGLQINSSRLHIILNGGNGSKGQDGSDGTAGEDVNIEVARQTLIQIIQRDQKLKIEDKNYLQTKKKRTFSEKPAFQKLTHALKFFLTASNGQMLDSYQIQDYFKGGRGGDGGKGGQGGNAGKAGTIHLTNLLIQTNNIFQSDGRGGQNGRSGRGGRGGINGPNASRIYLNQLVFAGLRKEGQQLDNRQQLLNIAQDVGQFGVNGAALGGGGFYAGFKAFLANQVGKQVAQQALKQGAMHAGKVSASIIGAIGIGVQVVTSPLCAYLNSGWIQQTQFSDPENERQATGLTPIESNAQNLQSCQQNLINRQILDFDNQMHKRLRVHRKLEQNKWLLT